MPTLVCEPNDLGFDEVAVDLPWSKGSETACALLDAVLAGARDARTSCGGLGRR